MKKYMATNVICDVSLHSQYIKLLHRCNQKLLINDPWINPNDFSESERLEYVEEHFAAFYNGLLFDGDGAIDTALRDVLQQTLKSTILLKDLDQVNVHQFIKTHNLSNDIVAQLKSMLYSVLSNNYKVKDEYIYSKDGKKWQLVDVNQLQEVILTVNTYYDILIVENVQNLESYIYSFSFQENETDDLLIIDQNNSLCSFIPHINGILNCTLIEMKS